MGIVVEVYPIPQPSRGSGTLEERSVVSSPRGVWGGAPAEKNDVWTFYAQFCAILIVF